jgi:hypothetical protein
MPNPTWPATLPQFVLEGGYQESLQDQTIETQMEAGPAKIRRRFTKSLRRFQMSLMLTSAQAATFETFWQTTCKGGSIPFDWVHPRTRVATAMRFRNPAPQFTSFGGINVIAQFNVEII